jgi:hypothetical protein
MSTLVIVLTAAMAVPGNGPDMVSGETRQGLDLNGRWEGTLQANGQIQPVRGQLEIERGAVTLRILENTVRGPFAVIDEGEGRLRLKMFEINYFGIYQQGGDRVVLCLRRAKRGGYPTSFVASDDQAVFILHRVKSRK